jgi:hypothetical protein
MTFVYIPPFVEDTVFLILREDPRLNDVVCSTPMVKEFLYAYNCYCDLYINIPFLSFPFPSK